MSRIAKQSINQAIDFMADTLRTAAGPDKRISERDAKKAIKGIEDKVEKDAVRQFHKFAAARSTQADGAQLGLGELRSAAAYLKKNVLQYDKNANGLSTSEVAEMPKTSQLAVRLAQAKFSND